jgi:hypothetical protein
MKKTKTVVNQYQIMETPGKGDETSQGQCLLAKKCKAKEASREDVLANKLTFPRAYTSQATEAVLAKSKQTTVMTMMRPTKTKRNTVIVQGKKNWIRREQNQRALRKTGNQKESRNRNNQWRLQ